MYEKLPINEMKKKEVMILTRTETDSEKSRKFHVKKASFMRNK